MKISTAGASHGEKLIGILEDMPSNVPIKNEIIEENLNRRRKVYGRSQRQEGEKDVFKIISGITDGLTNGSPIGIEIPNAVRDVSIDKPTIPRPGHADLAGVVKYKLNSTRDVIERASARGTAVSVALESIARQILIPLGIEIISFSKRVGKFSSKDYYSSDINKDFIYKSPVRAIDQISEEKMITEIDNAKKRGDSVGGEVQTIVRGLPIGLGSFAVNSEKLDSKLAGRLFSIQSVKGISIGRNLFKENIYGKNYHDVPYFDGKIFHKTNNAGGIEGGMTNGEDIVIDVALKAIPTMTNSLDSFDLISKEKSKSIYERSDVCQVPAATAIIENAVAFIIANEVLEKFGRDSFDEVLFNYENWRKI